MHKFLFNFKKISNYFLQSIALPGLMEIIFFFFEFKQAIARKRKLLKCHHCDDFLLFCIKAEVMEIIAIGYVLKLLKMTKNQ